MQVVLLAAGNSTRFVPFNKGFAHKSLVKIMGKTLIEHTLIAIKKSGITEVIIVVNSQEAFKKELGNGEKIGLSISYVVLPEALGMGAALLKVSSYIKNSFFLLNAYHVEFGMFASEMLRKQKEGDVVLLGKENSDYNTYGFMQLEEGKVKQVIEKPAEKLQNALQIIGIYLLNKKFVDLLQTIPLEHYNFEKALDIYAKKYTVVAVQTDKQTITLKYPWDLLGIKDYLLATITKKIAKGTTIAPSAKILGDVQIEEGAVVMENVTIKGPSFLGKNAFVGNNTVLRNGVCLEEGAVAGSYLEVKNAIIMDHTTTHTGILEDSIIGRNCKIAAGLLTANVRLDRKSVQSVIKGEKIDSKLSAFGMILGNNSQFGIRVSTMPGVVIGNNVIVGPETIVKENIEDNKKYYTKFESIVEEQVRDEK